MYNISSPPPGSVIAYAGQLATFTEQTKASKFLTKASGWMVCDGSSLNINDYPFLFAAIGYLYSATEDGTNFNIPDYRGYFLRMVNSTSGDPSLENREVINSSNKNFEIATKQEDALHTHVHSYKKMITDKGATLLSNDKPTTIVGPAKTETPLLSDGNAMGKQLSKQETRSKNMAVYYIIKYI